MDASSKLEDAKTRLHEDFLRHRETLEQGREQDYRAFDRHIIALASGAIALSVVYHDKIAQKPIACTNVFLWLSWIFFLLSLIINLLSFIFGKKAHDSAIARWDKYYELQKQYYETSEKNTLAEAEKVLRRTASFSSTTAILKYSAFGTFCAGLVLLCLFAALNL